MLGHPVAQFDQRRMLLCDACERFGKRVAQPLDQLEHRQIDIAQMRADHVAVLVRIVREHPAEIAEELGQPMLDEILRPHRGLGFLIFVIQAARDRVMRIVNLDDEVGHRQLQLMRPEPARVVARREAVPRAEKQQDVRRLPDDLLTRLQERRRERQACHRVAFQQPRHRRHAHPLARRFARDVDVFGFGRLEREPDEFAAALNVRPVVKLVAHAALRVRCVTCDIRRSRHSAVRFRPNIAARRRRKVTV